MSSHVDLESMIVGPRTFFSKMPFPSKESFITRVPKSLGHRNIVVRKIVFVQRRKQTRVAIPTVPHSGANPVSNFQPGWIFTRHDACSRRTANLTRRITASELHALCGNPINMWAFIKSASLIA